MRGNLPEEWEVHFFYAYLTQKILSVAKKTTDEEIFNMRVASIGVKNAIPNLPWLLAMARCMDNDLQVIVKEYIVSEQYY